MLIDMKSILLHAHENNYAVMAINCINLEMVKAAINGANRKKSPIIINIGQGQMRKHADIDAMIGIIKALASKSSVPVALNLDHGSEYAVEYTCIQKGFTNVMYDGSSLSFEENIRNTKLICTLAHSYGVSVEAELGHVGQAVNNDSDKKEWYTDPELAKKFIDETNVDCLAVAFGTAHGKYPTGFIPKLDFDRLKAIKEATKIPLVMHGGSGSGEENIRKAVAFGINKINICTDAFKICTNEISRQLEAKVDYLELCINTEKKLQEFIEGFMDLIGSSNRYQFNISKSDSLE